LDVSIGLQRSVLLAEKQLGTERELGEVAQVTDVTNVPESFRERQSISALSIGALSQKIDVRNPVDAALNKICTFRFVVKETVREPAKEREHEERIDQAKPTPL